MDKFLIGNTILIDAEFTDLSQDALDPDTVVAKVADASRSVETFTYGEDAEVTRLEAGMYRLTFTPPAAGKYTCRFEGTTEAPSSVAAEIRFLMQAGHVL